MTALGTLTMRTASSIYEARRKIHGLATALGLDDVNAVRLATAASQVCRAVATGDGGARIEAGLRVADSRAALVLEFLGRGGVAAPGWLAAFFDSLEQLPCDNGGDGGLRAVKWLPPQAGVPAPELIEAQRQRLQQRSREELMQEIQAQNEALERHSAQLEQTVTERTLELRRAMDAAAAANRAKSEFLSNMSHELRTPLNGVLGYAQILQRDPGVTAKQRRSLEAIHSCGQHLLTLINDVLDLSKIEAGKLEIELAPCDVPQLLRSVYDIVRPRAEGRGLAFSLEIDPALPAGLVTDKTKLKQTLVNLAGNAVKFTEEGSVILRARRDGAEIVFDLQDTGIGMTPQEAVSVFDPFKQAEGGKKHGGTGLGLAISKRMVEAMGTVGVVSRKGVGSTFTVRLKLQEADVRRPVSAVDVIVEGKDVVLAPGQDVHLLIADDTPANRDILVTILEDAGFRTTEAVNGREAVELLRQHRCPMALMDVRMPVMDGLQAVAAIRAEPALTKVIAVTASVIDFQDRAASHGFDDLVGKPVRVEELFETIRRHLGVRYIERGAAAAPPLEPAVTRAAPVPPPPAREMPPAASPDVAPRLRAALRLRNLTAINHLSEQLAGSPATAQLGQRISELAQGFDFKGLEHLASQLEAAAVPRGKGRRLIGVTAEPSAPAAPAPPVQYDRILLVDDTPTNLHVLYQALDGRGYELLIAQSGEEALALAVEARPALVLLDIMMPGIDGFETCRRLKTDPGTRDSAVIFMSALDDTRDKVRGLEVGAVDYITKPFQAAEVIARVRTHLELRRLHRELAGANATLAAANRKMKQDLAAAAMVQRALLPSSAPELAGYLLGWRYRPCDELAGDSLNVFPLRDGHLGAYVLDVSGHGVAASLLAVSVTQSIVPRDGGLSVVTDPATGGIGAPALVAARLNDRYPMSEQANRYFTLAYGVLEPSTGRFRYVCAGHPGPVLVRAGGVVEGLDEPNFAIGMVSGADYAESVVELQPGDRIYLHSDGLLEEMSPQREQFGRRRLHAQLRATLDLSLQVSIDALVEAVLAWCRSAELSDDVTVLAIERAK